MAEKDEKTLNTLKMELNEIDEKLKRKPTEIVVPEIYAQVEAYIKNYLKQISGVMSKVLKLSQNLLIVKNGRVYFNGNVTSAPFTYDNIATVAEEQVKRINYCLKFMAEHGVAPRYLAEMGKSLQTIYDIYDSLDLLGEQARKEEVKQLTAQMPELKKRREFLLKEISDVENEIIRQSNEAKEKDAIAEQKFKTKTSRFNFEEVSFPQQAQAVSLPIGINKKERKMLTWEPSGGLLCIKSLRGYEQAITFAMSLMMQFLCACPNSRGNVLYFCNKLNDDVNVIMSRMKKMTDSKVFFEKRDFVSEKSYAEVFESLSKLYSERTSIIYDAECETVEEYNMKVPNNYQVPVLVILQNYPSGYDKAVDLVYLLRNGKKYGVYYVIIQTKEDLKVTEYNDDCVEDPKIYANVVAYLKGDNLEDIEVFVKSKSRSVGSGKGELVKTSGAYEALSIDNKTLNAIIDSVGKQWEKGDGIISYESLNFGRLTAKPADVAEVISIPVGVKENNDVYNIEFAVAGEAKPYAFLLVGAPSSGKSSLIDSMIYNGAMKYSPDDLIFYLIDFKDGVSASMYTKDAKMPHIKTVASGSKQEEAEIILNSLIREQAGRNKLFKEADVRNLADYNKKQNAKKLSHIPRIVVVLDEASVMFKESDDDAERSQRLMNACETIVRQGRSAGIHLVMASQSVESKMQKITDFINGRFCFDIGRNENAAEIVVGREGYKRVITECSGVKGTAIASSNSGLDLERVHFGYNDNKDAFYAGQVRDKWSKYPINTFKVGETSTFDFGEYAQEHTLYTKNNMGAPIGINYYTNTVEYIPFDDNCRTMFLVGEKEEIISNHLMSVMIYAQTIKAKVMLLDESKSGKLEKSFGAFKGVQAFESDDGYLDMISRAYAEFNRRKSKSERSKRHEPLFVIINNLQTLKSYRNDMIKGVDLNNHSAGGYDFDDFDAIMNAREFAEANNETMPGGKSMLLEMLQDVKQANDFYICVSVDQCLSIRDDIRKIEGLDCIVLCAPFVDSMSDIAEKKYNHKLGATCGDTISLIAFKNSTAMDKIRYFEYGSDSKTLNCIGRIIGGVKYEL